MNPLLRKALPYLVYGYVTLVGKTSKIIWDGLEYKKAASEGGGFIYAFWHQRQVLFTYTHRGAGASVLVSRSKDGEIIAQTMRLSGINAVRGSSSRGGQAAARELVELLAAGRDVGITPDGPKGPARKAKYGALYLAQKTGRPLLPLASSGSRRIELSKSWDRFHVPLPFSRIAVAHAEPLYVPEGADLDEAARELERRLDMALERADALARGAA